MLRKKIFFCLFALIALFGVIINPIYIKKFDHLKNTFAPINLSFSAPLGECQNFELLFDTGKIKNKWSLPEHRLRFYPLDPNVKSPHLATCIMSGYDLSKGITRLDLEAKSLQSIQSIQYINLNIGSKNFYIPQRDLLALTENNTIKLSSFKLSEEMSFINAYGKFNFVMQYLITIFSFPILLLIAFLGLSYFAFFGIKPRFYFFHSHPYWTLLLIIILATLLRLNGFVNFGLWGDELYSIGKAAWPEDSWMSVFIDPGNPPFYNFLLKIWLTLFGVSPESTRLLSVLLGILGVFSIYIFLSKHTQSGNQAGLLGAFLFAISHVLIGASHEVRGYVLEATLIPLVAYFLWNLYSHFSYKNILGYCLSAMMLVNTHYYGSIVVASMFLWSAYHLKEKKSIFKLFILNVIVALSLLPFFIIRAIPDALGNKDFNTWIPEPSLQEIFLTPYTMLGSSIWLGVFVFFFLLALFFSNQFKSSRILQFSITTMILINVLPFLVSFLRPIYFAKYTTFALYPFVLSLSSLIILEFPVKTYKKIWIALCLCIMINALLDQKVMPIGLGDNYKTQLEFITADSKTQHTQNYIPLIDWMARKQYEIYGLNPQASFINSSEVSKRVLNQDQSLRGLIYFDNYYTDDLYHPLKNHQFVIQPIYFGQTEGFAQRIMYKIWLNPSLDQDQADH